MALLLDIRTHKEFCKGHLCNANLIETKLPPLNKHHIQKLEQSLINLLKKKRWPKTKPIYLYCKKGIRAGIASKILVRLGFKKVIVLGGIEQRKMKKYIDFGLCYCSNL